LRGPTSKGKGGEGRGPTSKEREEREREGRRAGREGGACPTTFQELPPPMMAIK